MHGLIFVTWEKFLLERLGIAVLNKYRAAISGSSASVPLTTRVYDDTILLTGIATVARLTGKEANTLLREYGRYFITNGLTSHFCAYLLTHVHSARDLVLIMRTAHAQMYLGSEMVVPLVFTSEILSDNPQEMLVTYDSHRQLCPMLYGAIEGAAERYGEAVHIVEHRCMQQGANACVMDVRFSGALRNSTNKPATGGRQREQRYLTNAVLQILPAEKESLTFQELLTRLNDLPIPKDHLRPTFLLGVIHHLQQAGLISSTANKAGDDLAHRRYWRVDG